MRPHLPAAIAGWLGLALNLVAVAALREVPHTYAPGDVAAWLSETRAHPLASTVSAWSFTLGLVLLAAWAAGLAAALRSSTAVVAASLFGLGALLDAAGTLGVVAALHVDDAPARALLWLTLLLDSAFNALLGLGLLAFAFALPGTWPRGLRALGLVAGLVSLPVGLQFVADDFARLLALSAPLWLTFVAWTGVVLARPEPARV